jgi:hypothetical protein
MLRMVGLVAAMVAFAACGTLQSSSVDETSTPPSTPADLGRRTINAVDETETPAPSNTPSPGFTPSPVATAARGSPRADVAFRCASDPTPDPIVAATEAALPSATPDPNFVPDYAATGTAEAVGTVPSGEPYCPDGSTPMPVNQPPPPVSSPPTPLPAGSLPPLTFSPGSELTLQDLYTRGGGAAGRGAFNIASMHIPKLGIDAAVSAATVGPDGKMPDVPDLTSVLWYDFSAWPNLGGLPGAGGNAVFAGKVGEPSQGDGIFVHLYTLVAGDQITLRLSDGSVLTYRVEFNKTGAVDAIDWQLLVSATADESMTIISGVNTYTRRIVWARRVS